jgi:hypothetical protein
MRWTKKTIIINEMKIKSLLFLLIVYLPSSAYGQSGYFVGTSQESIEPDQSLISLHLGGYGAPKEGRFTLQWRPAGNVPEVSTIAGVSERLYIVSNNNLLWKNIYSHNSSWINAGKAGGIRSLAGSGGNLYAVNNNGELLVSRIQGNIKWKKKSEVDKSVTSLAASGNMIFASNMEGDVWSANLDSPVVEWSKLESFKGITDLTADNRKLYALTKEGTIFQYEFSKKNNVRWLKAAYKNGITIKEDIVKISIAGNSIFGVGRDNLLYEGEHRTEGNLTARAMAVKGGENIAIIVNVDVCGLTDTFTGMIKQELREKRNIQPAGVFINSSHTHFAPVSQEWLTWQEANQEPDSIYLFSIVKNGILAAIENALEAMIPADLYFGRGKTDIGYNRSLKEHPELYDSSVDVIKVDYQDNISDSYLFLASCHPVFSTAGMLHYTISANYPGVARKLVEERTRTTNSLFLQGTAGDINPVDNGEFISGEKLANEVISVLNKPMTRIEGGISFYLDTIDIPVTPWSKEDILVYREQNIAKPGDLYAEKNVRWSDLMLKYYEEGTMPSSMPVYVNTINIGNWKLVGFSRETTSAYGLGVKNLWPDKIISVAGYTNDVSSYLPTHMHLEKRNYEGLDSFFWYGMPNVFPMTVDETVLDRVKDLER